MSERRNMIHVLLHWSIFGKTQVGDSVQRWLSVSAASNQACAAVASYLQICCVSSLLYLPVEF